MTESWTDRTARYGKALTRGATDLTIRPADSLHEAAIRMAAPVAIEAAQDVMIAASSSRDILQGRRRRSGGHLRLELELKRVGNKEEMLALLRWYPIGFKTSEMFSACAKSIDGPKVARLLWEVVSTYWESEERACHVAASAAPRLYRAFADPAILDDIERELRKQLIGITDQKRASLLLPLVEPFAYVAAANDRPWAIRENQRLSWSMPLRRKTDLRVAMRYYEGPIATAASFSAHRDNRLIELYFHDATRLAQWAATLPERFRELDSVRDLKSMMRLAVQEHGIHGLEYDNYVDWLEGRRQ